MKTSILVALCLLLASTTAVISGGRSNDPIGVAVSPQMLILGFDQGGAVTVHTDDFPLSDVDEGKPITLNGVTAEAVWADDCGDMVARFNEEDIEATVQPGEAELLLEGTLKDGESFSGTDTVKVMQAPQKN